MTRLVPNRPSIAHRILDCFPSGSYALGTLLRLVDIVETEQVSTAAVECKAQPRMLINPRFVERWAATSEKLLMLVMHELHHVLLGHTRRLAPTTVVDNLVFDAVINSMLCRMFPQPEFTSMFTDFYSDKKFPECLLRPPAGFDLKRSLKTPPALMKRGRKPVARVYHQLYSEKGATYEELYEVLRNRISTEEAVTVILIGDHNGEHGSAWASRSSRSSVLFDVLRELAEAWPQSPDPLRGRSLASLLREDSIGVVRRPSNRARLRRLLRRLAGVNAAGDTTRSWRDAATPVLAPVPTFDRRNIVMRALGVRPLLHNGEVTTPRLVGAGEKVHVYVDVSGSIGDLKAAMYGAVLDCRKYVHRPVHLFSTTVADVSLTDMRRGRCSTTVGTDIACVAEHIHSNGVRRALLLTDGRVGRPEGLLAETMAKTRLGVALTSDFTIRDDLQDFANYWTELSDS